MQKVSEKLDAEQKWNMEKDKVGTHCVFTFLKSKNNETNIDDEMIFEIF